MDVDLTIIPECYVDTNLVETIVPPHHFGYNGYNHQKGCSVAAQTMLKHKVLANGFALGIIDKDKKELDYSKLFELIAEEEQLLLLKHPEKHHYFIQIVGGMEKWILQNAASVGISLSDFDLPDNFEALKKVSKRVTTKKDDRFKRLFKTLLRERASGIMLLRKWITHLKSNPYEVDLDCL